jgi:hypothetical protein
VAIAINTFGTEDAYAILVIALAYIIQVQSTASYVKLTANVFGPEPYFVKAKFIKIKGRDYENCFICR